MAKARMLHKKISVSLQVNRLTLPARLLFTWMIPHADDEGKMKGDPEFIKATVVPMVKWSFKKILEYLEEIQDKRLIYYWQENGEWFIEFIKWKEHQYIQKDRFKPSDLPSFRKEVDNKVDTDCIQSVNTPSPQANISESNPSEVNKSESSGREREYEGKPNYVADKNIGETKKVFKIVYPDGFEPSNGAEVAAKEAWEKLEPNKPQAFAPTYLSAVKKGLPENLFYQFVSEIRQSPNIDNPGKVFNKKVKDYLAQQARE